MPNWAQGPYIVFTVREPGGQLRKVATNAIERIDDELKRYEESGFEIVFVSEPMDAASSLEAVRAA